MSDSVTEFLRQFRFRNLSDDEIEKINNIVEKYGSSVMGKLPDNKARVQYVGCLFKFSPFHPDERREARYFYAYNWFKMAVVEPNLSDDDIWQLLCGYPYLMSALFDEIHEKKQGHRWK